MNLSFSTHFPKGKYRLSGKPTYFVEKIWQSFPVEETHDVFTDYIEGLDDFSLDAVEMKSKIHTIRKDKKDIWKPGRKIHFVINPRSKDRFQFAPVIECVNTQIIRIDHHWIKNTTTVTINGLVYGSAYKNDMGEIYRYDESLKTLAINDGFDSVQDFFTWFNKDFQGKIIHWTDLKY
jgi:hypothetical protein